MTTRRARWALLRWLVVTVATLLVVDAGAKYKCVPTSKCTDEAVLSDVRAAIEAACLCESQTDKKTHRKCAKGVIKAQRSALGSAFPKPCQKDAKKGVVNSTCGRSGFVLCNKTNKKGTKTTCRVTRQAKCENVPGRSSVCDGFTSCLDACNPSGGCATTTSTTTVPKRALGEPCSVPADCQSDECTDGVCCDAPCDDACAACNVDGNLGTCSDVPEATPEPLCGGVCDSLGTCINGDELWSRQHGALLDSRVNDLAVDSEGNLLAGGEWSGTIDLGDGVQIVSSNVDAFVAKYASDGSLVWKTTLGMTGVDRTRAVAVLPNDDVVAAGMYTVSIDVGGGAVGAEAADIFLVALDGADGSILKGRVYGDAGDDLPEALAVDHAGNVLIAGTFGGASIDFSGSAVPAMDNESASRDAFVTKLDGNLNFVWQRSPTVNDDQNVYGLAADSENRVIVVGEFVGDADWGGGPLVNGAGGDAFVASLLATGAHWWSRSLAGNGFTTSDAVHDVTVAANDDVFVTGRVAGGVNFGAGSVNGQGNGDAFVAQYREEGSYVMAQRFGDGMMQTGRALTFDVDGNLIVSGGFEGAIDFGGGPLDSLDGEDIFLAKFGAGGTLLWSLGHGGIDVDRVNGVAASATGIFLGGSFRGALDFGNGLTTTVTDPDTDGFVAKLAP